MDPNPVRHGRVSDRELCGDFYARLYFSFQFKPSWTLGWSPFCKIFKDFQYISSIPQGDQRCQLLGTYEIMRKKEYSGDNTNFIEGVVEMGKEKQIIEMLMELTQKMEKGFEEVKGEINEVKERLTELEENQDKTYDLLTTVSKRVSAPLDSSTDALDSSIDALAKRVWTVEKAVSSIQRRLLG
ncbi:hypothetical protein M670_03468 [Schinkia azotoformans MEV2011]|uniref:Uncharacterized protein n=3 Tax=Schinkia azotoformans TaxID=1454 RepID=A0A072NIY4_SCHAZ|nr:hypothetical protein M670_03468 [Schinkia azotoformans MEV2011]